METSLLPHPRQGERWLTEVGLEVLVTAVFPAFVLAVPVTPKPFYFTYPLPGGGSAVLPLETGMDKRVLSKRLPKPLLPKKVLLEAVAAAEGGPKHPRYRYCAPPEGSPQSEKFEEELSALCELLEEACYRYSGERS